MKCFQFAIVLVLSVAASILAQSSEPATRIRKFELDWLTASLNGDPKWEQRFLDGKLDVTAADANGAQQRNVEIAEMLRTPLSANLIKVRITGLISLLTSDPAQNRSFRFLDTFNKKNGKWQVIATSIAPAQETASTGIDRDQIEHELTRLENAWAQVDVTNDRSIFRQIIALDFVATDSRGVLDRDQWLKQWE